MVRYLVLGLSAACLALPVSAANTDQLVKRQLQRQLQINPDDPVAMAQLARIYMVGGSPAKAAGLYRALLTLDDVLLERAGGATISSHALAARALKSLEASRPVRLGAR